MTNPTRQEIVNAYEALSDITYLADTYLSSISGRLDETRELRQTILRALPPLPRPTMAEVEWDDDKHYLAEAAHPDHGKVIMVGRKGNLLIDVFYFSGMRNKVSSLYATDLTPTGKRYTLTEVQE
ncbi:hypothetical protein QP943_02950 [Corynebacterium kefirresidentii]|jgi:hypothetical protein|uniref:Uncharacterized protein n=1 Tax=Corynebacterium kefirresidentii TaxID=1979527 RepID=A0ABT8Q664_9CORY|nr:MULTISPECIES: hypothetical protein [Corynebacterium]WKS53760.1 hypothetical protein NLL48_00955 [Corynebacterium tuberculostearicum]ERS46165.1 hypothetical protein HMPREF1282_02094 [Corynebacterium sp. KPL1856]ERS48516.1 hypothetical protein HMPREF1286_01334 [Corynebacterium sp. KPL1860]ERS56894.1 hypothetical protein HMPREF1264_00598 [Corynebacterium sp. KPL1821]ERS63079.1 hypothetical protein HMPREF1260_00255 [Corynebacterium sp. KPL1817]